MPRIVPSQVVDVIDSLFPNAKDEVEGSAPELRWDDATRLLAILELTAQIPEQLLILKSMQYAEYVASLAAIRWYVERWQTSERVTPPHSRPLTPIPGLRRHSPVALIRQALDECPDEFPSTGTSELAFIADSDLRENLRLDVGTINTALGNGEWKSATVLAGSVIEALLLWVLQQNAGKHAPQRLRLV